jgi:hypothetical protein
MDQTSASASVAKQHEAPSGIRKHPYEAKAGTAMENPPAKRHREVFAPPSDIAAGDHSTPRAERLGGLEQRLASP